MDVLLREKRVPALGGWMDMWNENEVLIAI